jgi:hypothetical protein
MVCKFEFTVTVSPLANDEKVKALPNTEDSRRIVYNLIVK